eukprot:PhM_4_TR7608/c0_g2_i1/m.59856
MEVVRNFEKLVAFGHDLRYAEAKNTVTHMQKDETCFSAIKRGGCNRSRRVRVHGSTWAHILVDTTRDHRATQVFAKLVEKRDIATLTPHVAHLAAGPATRVRTDGWKANHPLARLFRHQVVNHRRCWVDILTGIHTQTVESMNNLIKRNLKCRGNKLGHTKQHREHRVKFL